MGTINFMSDTVTLPGKEMKTFMFNAELGDDVFQQDPTVNALEEKAASMFGKPSALFCPSGTMTNQIAIKTHTEALDEMICDEYSHVYQYETGGFAFNSGISVKLIKGKNGKITAKQIEDVIQDDFDWLPKSKLVVLENSCNKGGGSFYTLNEIDPIAKLCSQNRLKLHLDGARIFNVLVETGEIPQEVGKRFDSISICLSKGLGAPVGSLLIGNEDFIKKARRFRKVMGGGMRQAGIIAAAGIFALDHNISRLKIDNDRAKILGDCLKERSYVTNVRPVETNIVIFDLKDQSASEFLRKLNNHHIYAVPFGPNTVRFVTHLDITENMIDETIRVLKQLEN